ncbi:tyrosyl-DNA phosphodiesterase-domain-containing protein [Rhypophila decipiens]|uniref:Tyrosyl-DNA phosphodiesterase-domain-containing protein n=1 Tax=Rhypophila decipiens TaxID=261697 RepID=A0AAN6YGN7_9PEZI|nr:tyrosyl-DNA phosphodiesterase-domain-containing protein [Rhypophila decipiens]
MASPPNGMEDEEDEAIRIALALSLGEDPDALPLGTPPRPSDLERAREARERAQERQRIRIRDQARDLELDRRERSAQPRPVFDYQSAYERVLNRSASSGTPPAGKKDKVTFDLTLDDDDDDDEHTNVLPVAASAHSTKPQGPIPVKDGKALELNGIHEGGKDRHQNTSSSQPTWTPPSSSSAGIGGLLGGLDRRKMEEERLARLKKRKASELTEDHQEGKKVPTPTTDQQRGSTEASDLSNPRPLQRRKLDWPPSDFVASLPSSSGQTSSRSSYSTSNTGRTSSAKAGSLPFPRGVVKKTWCRSQARLGDDIKIEEVFQKDKLRLAVLSSFQWDDEWLISKLDMSHTRVVLVAFAADDAQKEEMESNVPRDRIRFCFPPMKSIGAMHSKLQLLKYDDYIRIVVPTGNLVPYDWGETGVMENMVFIIDLPKLSNEDKEKATLTTFGQDLSYFLIAQGLDDKLVDSLKNYDFSETERYGFVHSICGSQGSGDAWKQSGYCALGRVVKGLALGSEAPVEVDFVCASLGALNDSLLNAIYYACQGDDGLKEFHSRTTKSKGKLDRIVRSHMRVYFPSRETVERSRGGPNAAGTICFQSRWFQAPTFPTDVMRDCTSTRPGILMHSKIIFVRLRNERSGPSASQVGGPGGFIYVGSANLSESAWGRLVKDRNSGEFKVTCRNWECGVILPADSYRDDNGRDGWSVFDKIIPIPMEQPAAPLAEDGPRRPWFLQERR